MRRLILVSTLFVAGCATRPHAQVPVSQPQPVPVHVQTRGDLLGLTARPNSRLSVPLIGELILNEQKVEKRSSSKGSEVVVTVNALHLALDGILGKGDVIVSQSMCKARGKGIGKDLKVVSTTNGNDTSDQIDDDDSDDDNGGLLDGVVDNVGILNANSLLGGGLLNGGL